jgi:hypothetical protein
MGITTAKPYLSASRDARTEYDLGSTKAPPYKTTPIVGDSSRKAPVGGKKGIMQ